jgi:hypothetical protein
MLMSPTEVPAKHVARGVVGMLESLMGTAAVKQPPCSAEKV